LKVIELREDNTPFSRSGMSGQFAIDKVRNPAKKEN
jgi:hypothetical protein